MFFTTSHFVLCTYMIKQNKASTQSDKIMDSKSSQNIPYKYFHLSHNITYSHLLVMVIIIVRHLPIKSYFEPVFSTLLDPLLSHFPLHVGLYHKSIVTIPRLNIVPKTIVIVIAIVRYTLFINEI